MTIETQKVAFIEEALKAMRNPHKTQNKGDTDGDNIGPADLELSNKLVKLGPPHDKHMRLIQVKARITAPLYWWKQFDTYRMGVEKLSESSMYTITNFPFRESDFEKICYNDELYICESVLPRLNTLRGWWLEAKTAGNAEQAKKYWKCIIAELPCSYLQTRDVLMSYAAIGEMIKFRRNHKLDEWAKTFIDWTKTLPHSELFEGYYD